MARPVDEPTSWSRRDDQTGGRSLQRLLSRVVFGLRLDRIQSEVELVRGF
jgi:hypothetical protein